MAETQEVLQKKKNGSNGGTKALAVTSAVAATALGIFAGFSQYVTPLRQDFKVLQEQTRENFVNMKEDIREKLAPLQAHAIKGGHPDSVLSRLELLKEDLEKLRADTVRHESLKGHPGLVSEMSSIDEKLKEIETQFRWSSDVRDRENGHINQRLENVERDSKDMARRIAIESQGKKENDAVISLLWEKVFGVKMESVGRE